MSGTEPTAPVADAVIASQQDLGYKVFAGNLSFRTTDQDLKEAFSTDGKVAEAVVIYRGTRSLGYGFVTYDNEADAVAAVSRMDKAEVGGRQINVELAKPPATLAAGRIAREAAKAAVEQGMTEGEVIAEGDATKAKRTNKPRNKRGPKSRRPRTDNDTEEAGDAQEGEAVASSGTTAPGTNGTTVEGEASTVKPKKKKNNKKKGPKAAATNGVDATGDDAAISTEQTQTDAPADASSTKPRGRKPREPRGPPQGDLSKTLLFVANLPYSVTDEELAQVFEGLSVKSANVVKKKHGPSEGRSKGFAFVDFEDEKTQQQALKQFHGKEVAGRQISLKVAVETQQPLAQGTDAEIVAS
ncbi:hypothetical protein OIO90_002318 [Microbotryomycetes sp. JL221]|nr:hypothetical protein OIO90_002318 [Microbotryomycetes sp. JL221]